MALFCLCNHCPCLSEATPCLVLAVKTAVLLDKHMYQPSLEKFASLIINNNNFYSTLKHVTEYGLGYDVISENEYGCACSM